jgi:hypothetical protein
MAAQPSNEWSIQLINPDGSNNGTPATLASLGIESAVVDENNMAADVLALTVGGLAIDAAVLWNYGQLLALIDPNGVRRFFGRVVPWSREADPNAQNHIGRIENPWWYLEEKVYQQKYNFPAFNSQDHITGYSNYTTPRIVLYVLYQGAPENGNPATGFYQATTGQQIQDALNWAIGQGAPIQVGQMDPNATPWSSFQKGILCADVIKHAFRFEPDFKVFWDYTTTPFPTMHCLKQGSLTPLTIDLTAPGVREKVTIKERPDWQRSYVAIFYDQTESVDGQQYIDLANDYYPNPLTPPAGMSQTEFNFRGVDLFADLTGEKIGQQQQQANFASLPFDIMSLTTWRDWKPSLSAPNVTNVVIMAASTTPATDGTNYLPPALNTIDELDVNGDVIEYDATCTNEIVDGAWADWIAGGFGYTGPVYGEIGSVPPSPNGQRVRATAWAFITLKDGSTRFEFLSHDFTATNINTGGVSSNFTSTTQTNSQYAEGIPYGLAEYMWNAWKNLTIEGSFTNVEAVVGSSQSISGRNCLNFNTPNQAWGSVNAVIQKLTWDIKKGVTQVGFGAPLRLTGNALIDAIRATRFRITTIDIAYIFGGAIAAGTGTTRFARKHHARHSQAGATHHRQLTVSVAADPSNPTTPDQGGSITFDPTMPATEDGQTPTAPSAEISVQDIWNAWQSNTTQPTS